MADQLIINSIFELDDGTIGKLMKFDGTSGWFVCLRFPYFRLFRKSQIDNFTLIANDMETMLFQLNKQIVEHKWTLAAWREEVQYLTDDILEELYDTAWEEVGSSERYSNNIIEKIILDSEWLSEAAAQEKLIEYCDSLTEVTPESIMEKVETKDRHRWAALRKATAFCCLKEDVKARLKKELKREREDVDY